ncbi:MAG: PQQ-dependent sugar dehydrogenase [Ignavibacteria bacterium]|nr:PQQ-dependent sugar dehydrogenase [Ignavibacteria bacterium]
MEKGGNYGWPFVEGFCDSPTEEQFCKDSQIIEPQRAFTPTLAIAGIEYYDGKKFPQWKNSLLVASLRNPFFSVFPLNVNQDSVLDWWKYPIIETSRLRSVCVSPDGRIFLGKSQGDHYGTKNNSDNAVLEIVSEAVNIVDNPKAISRPEAIHSYIKDKTLIITNAWQLHSFKVYNNVGELITYSHNNDNNHSELQIPINYQGLLFISLRLKNGFFQNKALISIIN